MAPKFQYEEITPFKTILHITTSSGKKYQRTLGTLPLEPLVDQKGSIDPLKSFKNQIEPKKPKEPWWSRLLKALGVVIVH